MKDFVDTLGVVAGLLATITFTAAFTVPGGYEQSKGTPIFAKQVAFHVFMFTDVIGMCSSVMALFCLAWFFTSDQVENEGEKLGDLSMGLLQLSFYATLVAFMTGVYVTILPEVRWVAIITCVICSLVLLLMRKRFILNFLIYVFGVILGLEYLFSRLLSYIIKSVCCRCWKSKKQENNS